jgi:hypothetical protein
MSTTNLVGVIETTDGNVHAIQQEPTDGTPEAVTIYDISGTARNIYDQLFGKVIRRICIQASDGSILSTLYVTQNGARTHDFVAGERIANGPDRSNIDVLVNIPVNKQTRMMVDCTD